MHKTINSAWPRAAGGRTTAGNAKTRHAAGAFRVRAIAAASLLASVLAACGGDSAPEPTPTPNPMPTPEVSGDPLAPFQWHLKNTGQAAFAGSTGVAGIDLNTSEPFEANVNGKDIRVLVLDDGIDIGHPDLSARIDAGMLYNFEPGASSKTDPTPPGEDDAHGTAVAGIIAATANNGIGGRGVAPGVTLGGARFIDCGPECGTPVSVLDAYGGAPFSRNADVLNGSFGATHTAPVEFDQDSNYEAVAIQRLASLRGGRGAIFVQSAGNEYIFDGERPAAYCAPANAAGVTCSTPNLEPAKTMPQIVVTGAVNAMGVKSSYSSAGSNLLVAGLGGEYGDKDGAAIVTTDLQGCSRGYARVRPASSDYKNDFENPGSALARSLNAACDYTSTMNGTSASAPTVSGVVALMLQADPRLTWRDVRVILAKTARRVDAGRVARSVTLASGESYVPEPAWTRNAAGSWFDNWYGFGLVDAAAAVRMARGYTAYLDGPMKDSGKLSALAPAGGLAIPLGAAAGLEIPIAYPGPAVATIETVQVQLEIGSANMGDIAIELVSPAGTRSVLLNAYSILKNTGSDVDGFVLASNAFNGEPGLGGWKLRIIDVNARNGATPAVFKAATLRVYGH